MILNILLFLDSLGGGELMLILFVVLLFFGSKSLPGLAKGLGKGMREFRNTLNDVRSEIENPISDAFNNEKEKLPEKNIKNAADNADAKNISQE